MYGTVMVAVAIINLHLGQSFSWSTLMKRIHEPSAVVDELMPGTHYIFRVIAGNHIGSSEPSEESDDVRMVRSPLDTQFSMEPFDGHYELLDEIGRWVELQTDRYTHTDICTRAQIHMDRDAH